MKLSAPVRRTGATFLLAALVLLGPVACDGGTGDGSALPSGRPTVDRTGTTPEPEKTETPRETADRTPRPTRTEDTAPPPTTDQARPEPTRPEPTRGEDTPPATGQAQPPAQPAPPQTAPPQTTPPQTTQPQTTQPQAPPPTQPPASEVAAAETSSTGSVWCLLLIVLVGLGVGGLVMWRSRHGSDWDTEATTLAGTTSGVLTRLPSVLTTTTTAERALTWPPLRDDLGNLVGSWDVLASRTAEESRRSWAVQVRLLLEDLLFTVDQENEVLAAGREWRLLRPRVAAAEQALSTALAAQPMAATAVPAGAGPPRYASGPAAYPPGPAGYPPGPAAYPPEPAAYTDEPAAYTGEPSRYTDELPGSTGEPPEYPPEPPKGRHEA
jgi:hypothetical protein